MSSIETTLHNAAACWSLTEAVVRNDLFISGSPERSELRFVIENQKRLYVIESILHEDISKKKTIIQCLNHLKDKKLNHINPYIADASGSQIISCDNRCWMLSAYVQGVSLTRPDYVFERWRANPLAEFLLELRKAASGFSLPDGSIPFSIKTYIRTLLKQIRRFQPELMIRIEAVVRFLDPGLFKCHDTLPLAFCHGDYHPLNIIWSDDDIKTVIDWEFLGIKPELYDVANLLGCIGIEDPEGLAGEMVTEFIQRIVHAGFLSDISIDTLVDYMIALRFAWMSEWLRHNDKEMIEMETVYMNLLVNNYHKIREIWGIDN